jgi:hypothetical protein
VVNNLEQTLTERGARYGNFTSHARVTQDLKRVIDDHMPIGRSVNGEWIRFLQPDQAEALDMIAHKIGRILAGDPNYADAWHDIAGYAQLVANRLNDEGAQ